MGQHITLYLNKRSNEEGPEFRMMGPLPEEVLIVILSFLPNDDLLKTCPKVCKQWKEIIAGHTIWKIKCEREKKTIPPPNIIHNLLKFGLPKHFYRNIYLHNPYGNNLVINPSGKEGLTNWHLIANGGDGWKVEHPPAGAERKEFSDNQYCFATSFERCEKSQAIDLQEMGVDPLVMDKIQPTIHIEEWHAARFDCGAAYEITVQLFNSERKIIKEFYSDHEELQWAGSAWFKVEHDFKNYGPEVRWILYRHAGQDTQFWKGHYGAKIADSTVKIHFDT